MLFTVLENRFSEATFLTDSILQASLLLIVYTSDVRIDGVNKLIVVLGNIYNVFSTNVQSSRDEIQSCWQQLLVAHALINYFRHLVEGRPFILFTDHKLLTYDLRDSF